MAKFGIEDGLLTIYTELKANNEPKIETYCMPIMYARNSQNKFQFDFVLHISDDLQKRIEDLNKNMDLYSKIVLKYGTGSTIKVKG